MNCLKKYYARLIQSIVRIVSNQLDAPQEKNNNPTHPIDIKTPWIILHHVLQREEDMQPNSKRKLSNDSNESNEKDTVEEEAVDVTEDTIPKSIAIFFTAHEYLGSRSWCTRDKGQLLLYVMEMIVPRLRTPALEAFRDIIAEYLEQVTYCLYGYPAKRARLKHIEEHDAQNVDLEWNQAIQLYDLYRPDDLPEFDSFKYVKYISVHSHISDILKISLLFQKRFNHIGNGAIATTNSGNHSSRNGLNRSCH